MTPNSLGFVCVLLDIFCSEFVLFIAKDLFLFTTVNWRVLFFYYILVFLISFLCFNYTLVMLLGQNYLLTNYFFSVPLNYFCFVLTLFLESRIPLSIKLQPLDAISLKNFPLNLYKRRVIHLDGLSVRRIIRLSINPRPNFAP